jgi:hypothetical protein
MADDDFLREFNKGPAASEASISKFELDSGRVLPPGYKQFLAQSNGGEGFVNDAYLILWPVEDLAKFNADYEVEKYAPGLTLFGSDGGGEAFAFDASGGQARIVSIPFIGLDKRHARAIADDFPDFFHQVSRVLVGYS